MDYGAFADKINGPTIPMPLGSSQVIQIEIKE